MPRIERLARIIDEGDEFDIKELTARNSQRFESGYLVDRWQEEEPDWLCGSQIAKETALHALRRNPWQVLGLAGRTFAQYWNLRDLPPLGAILITAAAYIVFHRWLGTQLPAGEVEGWLFKHLPMIFGRS